MSIKSFYIKSKKYRRQQNQVFMFCCFYYGVYTLVPHMVYLQQYLVHAGFTKEVSFDELTRIMSNGYFCHVGWAKLLF